MLGWSWLFRPTAGTSTRARSSRAPSRSTANACAASARPTPRLGYELISRFAQISWSGCKATRLQLLDLYGRDG